MGARLSSHRFRRRLAWATAAAAVVATVVVGSILIGNTGRDLETPSSRERAWVYEEPKLHRLSKGERTELLETSLHFVRTAVARKHLDEAWELLGPEMRAGQTRKQWNTGTNNVVPFPAAGIAAWSVLYSYENDVAFDVMLLSEPGHDIVGKTFTIELKRYPQQDKRWLVASWTPRGLVSQGQSISEASRPPLPPPRAPLSAIWLLVPLSLLGLIVLIPAAVVVRSVVVHRRAARRYERDLQSYRSTSSPS